VRSESKRIKVVYIAGAGRSGSTLLDNILGQIEGFFTVGELRLWARRFLSKSPCGCGKPLRNCRTWGAIFDSAFGAGVENAAREMSGQIHTLPLQMVLGQRPDRSATRDYLARLEKLYGAIAAATGARVIVDSSKFPPYGYALGRLPSVELHVVHLVRDPRAVAYSWQRQKNRRAGTALGDDPLFRRQSDPVRSTLKWAMSNLMTEYFWKDSYERYLMLRYEDFIENPLLSIEKILNLTGEKDLSLPVINKSQLEVMENHTVSGNPVRFSSGTVTLRVDDEWRSQIRRSHRLTVELLAWPLLVRYGYAVSARGQRTALKAPNW
jgi:hypothetical protein